MSCFDGIAHRVRRLLRPGDFRRELEEEMQFHLALDAAQRHDARRFGNRTYYAEETRRMTWIGALDPIRQDLAYAWRSVVRAPGFTVLVVLTLALGLGATAALFSFLDRLYLRPPDGIHDPSTLRRIWVEHFNTGDGVPFAAEGMGGITRCRRDGAEPRIRKRGYVLHRQQPASGPVVVARPGFAPFMRRRTYFTVLGVRPALGRFFVADEDRIGHGAPVAVVKSYVLEAAPRWRLRCHWKAHYGRR